MATAPDVCGFCFKEPVFGFCKNCNISLGVSCFSNHTKITIFAGHIVFALNNSENKPYLTLPIENDKKENDIDEHKCQKHETEPQSFYCGRHDATICGRCIQADHVTCKDAIVDLHKTRFDKQKADALLATLNEIECEIIDLQVRVDGNAELNDECRASSINAIKEYRTKIDLRLNQLQFDAEQSTEKKHKENMDTLVEVKQMCKDVSLRIQIFGKKIEELWKKKQERHLFVYSKKLAIAIDEIRTAIKQSNFKNHITQFTFKEHPTLENILLKTILEIGTLQEACDGSEEIVDDTHDTFTGTPVPAAKRCAGEITQPKNVASGNQPPGKMTIVRKAEIGPLTYLHITYVFLDGQQPNGKRYKGCTEKVGLSDSVEGRNICRMLKVAFRRKLLFTINSEGAIVYNGIDPPSSHLTGYGIDRNNYYGITAQLEAKGITTEGIDTNDKLTETVTVD
ncbi:uncharacterized protein LOC127834143 [Dreissena polymorpha]|uniref:E3 ubiquitin-protein ligase n=1 Tax=Dreissena polymorpha TaxID=45954 RepID=A0A9D4JCZ9_DREPO|nr:uncharacterized protein LOC127834143 [Dreissena polymorpha]XP_052215738.1 uncharacterized protein LOC127834143 [Dreissena polymorpha]KAH3804033.1 hypothetical protein DPMN_132309 [Dreissena polymorpha]